jgi:hypothetical protein
MSAFASFIGEAVVELESELREGFGGFVWVKTREGDVDTGWKSPVRGSTFHPRE